MAFWNRKKQKRGYTGQVGYLITNDAWDTLCVPGYTSLDRNPEIITGVYRIAQLLGSISIHIMSNTERGDDRIINELSKKIDINPNRYQTRSNWIESIIINLFLGGDGNSIVRPHTTDGYLGDLEVIQATRVSFMPDGYGYRILIDGIPYDPDELLHFKYLPDKQQPWKGAGVRVSLQEVAHSLKQAAATKKGFMESKWQPSVIVKVDANVDEFSTPEKRDTMLNEYIKNTEAGKPWVIPAEMMDVSTIKPLTLQDLAIADTVQLDKRTVAAILGVPPFVLGVGEYNTAAWNAFVNNTIKPIALGMAQEMTKKLILSPSWYVRFNTLSLLDWDIKTIADVFGGLSDRGFVTGNEVRDRIGMSPADGLDEFRTLENFIPNDMLGLQKKLLQDDKEKE